jgi:hypothetical protein
MSIHTIITILVLYCAVRALLRKKPKDPMRGRLVPRGYALDMEAMKAEGTRQQRKRDEFNQKVWEGRLKFDEWRAQNYKRECAMRAWHAGYGEHP